MEKCSDETEKTKEIKILKVVGPPGPKGDPGKDCDYSKRSQKNYLQAAGSITVPGTSIFSPEFNDIQLLNGFTQTDPTSFKIPKNGIYSLSYTWYCGLSGGDGVVAFIEVDETTTIPQSISEAILSPQFRDTIGDVNINHLQFLADLKKDQEIRLRLDYTQHPDNPMKDHIFTVSISAHRI